MRRFSPQRQILPSAQQNLWPLLSPLVRAGFVLYGGTAVALRLGHRTSVDFDFFSDQALQRAELSKRLIFWPRLLVLQESVDALTVLYPDEGAGSVKLSFFGALTIGRVSEPELTDDGVLQVAALADLLATKLKVILQRAESKDYRDIAAMLRAGSDLAQGLAAARVLFGPNFQPSESLKALSYFGDGDLQSLDLRDKTLLLQHARAVRDLPAASLASTSLTG